MSRLRFWGRRSRVPVVELTRSNPVRFGIGLLIVIAIVVYFGFTKKVPYTHGYRINAVFSSAQDIAPKSPVKTAGVVIGAVTSFKREGKASIVTMEISNKGLPIHKDAELKIRPRLFLEGNWYVELRPGTPSSPTLSSGATIPISQTAIPVQIDQVLDALNTDTRANLQNFLIGYGEALMHRPTAAEDATQEPEARGLTGAEALKQVALHSPGALRGAAVVQQALGGVETHDISKLISGIRRLTVQLNLHDEVLGEWVDHFDHFFEEFSNQTHSLEAAVSLLPSAVHSASSAFAELNRAAPELESFAKALTPGVKQTRSTIAAALPWIKQVKKTLGPEELGGVAKSLNEATPTLAGLIGGQKEFFKQNNEFSQCLTKVFYPAGNVRIQDGKSTSGSKAYMEFWYTMVGLAGIGQNFDGNGYFPRFLATGGGDTLVSRPTSVVGIANSTGNKLIAHAALKPEGTSPSFPASEPPYKPMVPCDTQQVPNINGPLSHGEADGTPE
ncbi:MAG TPA: MlaD family protein [Solirubrobacteraceae bacterium]|jgi:ABC-type transporter Mla subunit MlaD